MILLVVIAIIAWMFYRSDEAMGMFRIIRKPRQEHCGKCGKEIVEKYRWPHKAVGGKVVEERVDWKCPSAVDGNGHYMATVYEVVG